MNSRQRLAAPRQGSAVSNIYPWCEFHTTLPWRVVAKLVIRMIGFYNLRWFAN